MDADFPPESVMTPSSPPPTLGGAAQSGRRSSAFQTVGIMLGKQIISQTIGILRTEIAAGGNEIAQAGVNNALDLGNMALAIVATKGLAAIGYVIQGTADAVVHYRQNARINRENAYQRELKDNRITFNQSSAYYGG